MSILFAFFLSTVSAATSEDASEFLLTDALLYDGTGAPARPGMAVLIREGRIAGIYEAGQTLPPVDLVYNLDGKTLMPGLVDLQVHLHSAPMFLGGWVPIEPPLHEAGCLIAGVTTVLESGNPDPTSFETLRVLSTGPVLVAKGGERPWTGSRGFIEVEPGHEAEALERGGYAEGSWIQIVWDNLNWTGRFVRPTFEEEGIKALIAAAHARSLKVLVSSRAGEWLSKAARAGADVVSGPPVVDGMPASFLDTLLESRAVYLPSIATVDAGFRFYDDRKAIEEKTIRRCVPELMRDVFDRSSRDFEDKELSKPANLARRRLPELASAAAALMDAGAAVALGSCGGEPLTFHGYSAIRELELWCQHGMPAAAAIRAATAHGAKALGLHEEIGAIRVGLKADLVVLGADPAQDPTAFRRVSTVFKDGVRLNLRELHSRLAMDRGPQPEIHPAPKAVLMFEGPQLDEIDSLVKTTTDAIIGGTSTINVSGEKDEEGFLRMEGQVEPRRHYPGFAGIEVRFRTPPPPWDVGDFRGIRLRCRGTAQPFRLVLLTSNVKDGNRFHVEFTPQEEWSEVRIPFASFRQLGLGRRVEWKGNDVLGLGLQLHGGEAIEFVLDLDEITLYEND